MRKYKLFLRVSLFLAIFLPVVMCLLATFRSGTVDPQVLFDAANSFSINPSMVITFNDTLINVLEIESNPAFLLCCTIVVNALHVYVFYLLAEALLFIVKFGIQFLHKFIGKDDDI